jgi:outer membrane protein assembly factor BamB
VLSRCEFERGTADGADHFLRCQVDGGLVLLETQTELVAFDINRSRQAASEAILWRYSLSRVPSGPQTPFSAATHVPLNSPLGFQTFTRGSNLREALVGPITPSGVLIQKESELMMLNALSGVKLWRRSGYDDRTTLVRHGLEIAVIHPSAGKIDILDCRDGQLLKQLPYQGDWTTWFVSQANVIQYAKLDAKQTGGIQTEANSGTVIRVLNAFSGEVLLEKEFEPGCRADVCADRYMAVLNPKGQLWYCDAYTIKAAEHSVPAQTRLDRVRFQQFGAYLVLMTAAPAAKSGNVQVTTAADENAQTKGLYPINGQVFALGASDGKLLWERPATLLGFTFPSAQPRSAPYMACYRVVRSDRSHTAHVVLIDLRDGTLAYFNTSLPLKSSECEFAMELNPSRLGVQLSINAYQINLSMTDGDKPPQPVCYFGAITAPRSKAPVGREFDLFNPAR